MRLLIDIRPLSKGTHSGIPAFTKEITERLIHSTTDSYELFYPGLRKQRLPDLWIHHKNVSVIDWPIPNKLLDVSNKFFHRPNIGRHTSAEIIFSPHFNSLTKGKLPRVLVIHDLSFAHHPNFFSPKQRLWHFLQDWQKQIREADHLVAVSHYTKEDIVKTLNIAPEKISVVYPGISDEFRPLDPHDVELLRFQKRHHLQAPYFLYFGTLETRKNIIQLIAAFDLLKTNPDFKNHELVLAGAPGYRASEIVKAVARSKSKAAIRIISRITDAERKFLYNGAIAFACTSFFEGFGFPVLEAQACGIPVVASARTSFIETLSNSAPLVSPWKPSELADALARLTIDATARSQAIALGFENVKRFRWETATHQIHAILKKTHNAFYG